MKNRLLKLNGISSMKKHDKTEELEAKLNALMEYQGLLVKEVGTGVYEVVKEEKATGDYTKPIQYVVGQPIMKDLYYWYDDYDLRKGALQSGTSNENVWENPDWFEQF